MRGRRGAGGGGASVLRRSLHLGAQAGGGLQKALMGPSWDQRRVRVRRTASLGRQAPETQKGAKER